MTRIASPAAAMLLCSLFASASPSAMAQDNGSQPAKAMSARERQDHFMNDSVDREYKLRYAEGPADQNEILTAIRNMTDPQTKIFLVPGERMIVVHAPEDFQAQVANLLTALDQPRPRFRLTYTFTELDGTRKIGVQHFSTIVTVGQRARIKEGSRIPIRTGTSSSAPDETQFTYLDVGVSVGATLTEVQGGGILSSTVEQTSIAPDSVSPSNPNPLIRQTLLEGITSLALNKPLMLGSLDVPSSTHHFDIEVVMEASN